MRLTFDYRTMIITNVAFGLIAAVLVTIVVSFGRIVHPLILLLAMLSVCLFVVSFAFSLLTILCHVLANVMRHLSKPQRAFIVIPTALVCTAVVFAACAAGYGRPFYSTPTFWVACLVFCPLVAIASWLAFECHFMLRVTGPGPVDVEEDPFPGSAHQSTPDAAGINSSDLTAAGWLLILVVAAAMLAVAVPLVEWLISFMPLDGARRAKRFLAIPVLAAGALLFCIGAFLLSRFGVCVIKKR